MIGFLIGAGVGLAAGAGLGFLIAALLANARVEAATTSEMQASRLAAEALTKAAEANERADGYLAELDALTESTRPAGDPSVLRSCSRCLVATDSARTCTVVGRLDGGCPECGACRDCISLAEQCAERDEVPEHCAERPDGDLSDVLSGRIRAENWAQQGLRAASEMSDMEAEAIRRRYLAKSDGQPTISWCPGWWDELPKTVAPELARLAEERRAETYEQNELDHDRIPTREGYEAAHPYPHAETATERFMAEDAARPHRPGMAIYPRHTPREGK